MLFSTLSAAAQIDEALEQLVTEVESEEPATAMADMISELQSVRPNLNDTASLSSIPLLSPFQQKALKNYIILYGQLLSYKELGMIPGYDSTLIAILEKVTSIQPYTQPKHLRLTDGHHNIITGLGTTIEQAAGYRDSTYDGDALHAQFVYNYNLHNRISVRLVAEKDPTEPWGRNNFYGYHLMLNNIGRLERLVIGRYTLQFGQGLTLWTGLQPFNLLGGTPQRFGHGIGTASTFYEQGYQEGLAATVHMAKAWHISAFASKAQGTRLLGGRTECRCGNLIAGLTLVNTTMDDSVAPAERIYNQDYFRGNRLTNVGMDANWQWDKLSLYGEVAFSNNMAAAAIAGASLSINSDNSVGISYRNYSRHYHNMVAQPYGIGDGRNEQGWTLDAKVRLPLNVDAMISANLYSFPSLRYGIYQPSSGSWVRTQLSRRLWHRGVATLRYAYRRKERNIPYSSDIIYPAEETVRHQIMGALHHQAGHWTFDTKAALSHFESVGSGNQQGWVVAQQVRYSTRTLQATASASLFDVDGYYARIYLSESCITYNFTMPAYYGQGMRACIMLRVNVRGNLTIAGKYAITRYFDRDTIGSAAAETKGPQRQTVYLQLRWRI